MNASIISMDVVAQGKITSPSLAPLGLLFSVAALLMTSLLLTGCGESKVAVYPVSGKVTYKGEAPAGAILILHPQAAGPDLPKDIRATGKVQPDGSYSIGVYDPKDGAPVGEYIGTITWNKVVTSDGGTGPGPNVLPKLYSDPKTSTIKISVKNGPNTIPPIELVD